MVFVRMLGGITMTLEQLEYFVEVCKVKSITLAASNLYVSRQAVSKMIKKLETEFDTELFIRTGNGIELTKAGETLYKHASVIVKESSICKQDMLQHSPNKVNPKICRVAVSTPLMNTLGNELYNQLSTKFPETYFYISCFLAEGDVYPVEDYDMLIILLSEKSLTKRIVMPEEYTSRLLNKFPIYIWMSSQSPYANYGSIRLRWLKDEHLCAYKNHIPKKNLTSFLHSIGDEQFKNIHSVELEQNLCDLIERHGYFAIDLPFYKGTLYFEQFFKSKNIVSVKSEQELNTLIIFNKKICKNFYPIISDIINQNTML